LQFFKEPVSAAYPREEHLKATSLG